MLNLICSQRVVTFSLAFAAILLSCQSKQENNEEVSSAGDQTLATGKERSAGEAKGEESTESYILIFGNSLTAGYGLEEYQSFPALLQKRLDSLQMPYTVVNAGLSGETTAGGLGRIDWVLRQPVDIFILELGANDVLRGLDLKATEENLRAILNRVRGKNPGIPLILAGMQAPPNMGESYTREFAQIYPKLASEFQAGLVPFLLAGVAADPALNQADGIHPNARGQKIVMENVWAILKGYLKSPPGDKFTPTTQ